MSNVVTIAVPLSKSLDQVIADLKKSGYEVEGTPKSYVVTASTGFRGRDIRILEEETIAATKKSMPALKRS